MISATFSAVTNKAKPEETARRMQIGSIGEGRMRVNFGLVLPGCASFSEEPGLEELEAASEAAPTPEPN